MREAGTHHLVWLVLVIFFGEKGDVGSREEKEKGSTSIDPNITAET